MQDGADLLFRACRARTPDKIALYLRAWGCKTAAALSHLDKAREIATKAEDTARAVENSSNLRDARECLRLRGYWV